MMKNDLIVFFEMKYDGKIKAPPSVGVIVVGLPGFLAPLCIWRGSANAKNLNLFNDKCAVGCKELALEPLNWGSRSPGLLWRSSA